MTELPDKNFFRKQEAARILGVHHSTVYRWIQEGRLQAVKTFGGHYRIPREEVEKILDHKRDNLVSNF